MLSRSVPRFLLQAGLLIAVAAVAAILHVGAVTIVVLMAVAFGAVVLAEWLVTRDTQPRPDKEEREEEVPESESVVEAPRARPQQQTSPLVRLPRRWNVFDLQYRARQIVGRDPARDEELSFLLLYLREFADASGELSEAFDTFVRESFPELVAAS